MSFGIADEGKWGEGYTRKKGEISPGSFSYWRSRHVIVISEVEG